MLKNLYIKKYAIIDEINIVFENGLTIITGETGAGKSILIGALSLVLGERADNQQLYSQTDKCIIEASFHISDNEQAKNYLSEHEFENGNELIIRREINPTGKSRVFINDTPTTLNILSPLGQLLLDLHRQFDTIELQHNTHQLELLDNIALHQDLMLEYTHVYSSWKKSEKELDTLILKNKQVKQELDYNTFTCQEIEALKLKPNEIEDIEAELLILENAESLQQSLQTAMQLLHNNETPVIPLLKQVIQALESQSKIHQRMLPLIDRLRSSMIEIKDIHHEIESEFEQVFLDEEKITILNDRLNEANRLLKKHHVSTTEELISIQNELSQKILQATIADEEELQLTEKVTTLSKQTYVLAQQLSVNRSKEIDNIELTINTLLKKVGMPNAVFKVSITPTEISKSGIDKVEFLFDANKTNQLRPIAKVASGGELSRLMLCIKSMVANSTALPTLIFDEIDTGISGETAKQVGNIMKQLSNKHQLISITHLPQIAGKADQHLYIYKKENEKGAINTYIKKLSTDERVDILAEMLSGKDSSLQAIEMVKELMK